MLQIISKQQLYIFIFVPFPVSLSFCMNTMDKIVVQVLPNRKDQMFFLFSIYVTNK